MCRARAVPGVPQFGILYTSLRDPWPLRAIGGQWKSEALTQGLQEGTGFLVAARGSTCHQSEG